MKKIEYKRLYKEVVIVIRKSLLVVKEWIKKKKRAVSAILALFVAFSIIMLLMPYYPSIKFKLFPPDPSNIQYNLSLESYKSLGIDISKKAALLEIPEENRLVIPAIGVDAEVHINNSLDILKEKDGVWLDVAGISSPLEKGNTVIAGHRFQYLPPNTTTFYNLDKLEEGDKIIILWEKKDYVYEVKSKSVVMPENVEVRNSNPEIEHELTLYTCEPLNSDDKRLVVTAERI